jgi:hypothetical protein
VAVQPPVQALAAPAKSGSPSLPAHRAFLESAPVCDNHHAAAAACKRPETIDGSQHIAMHPETRRYHLLRAFSAALPSQPQFNENDNSSHLTKKSTQQHRIRLFYHQAEMPAIPNKPSAFACDK